MATSEAKRWANETWGKAKANLPDISPAGHAFNWDEQREDRSGAFLQLARLFVLSGFEDHGQHIAANLAADSELGSRAIVDRQTLDKGNENAMNGLQRVV